MLTGRLIRFYDLLSTTCEVEQTSPYDVPDAEENSRTACRSGFAPGRPLAVWRLLMR
jgi:hypothetical protein